MLVEKAVLFCDSVFLNLKEGVRWMIILEAYKYGVKVASGSFGTDASGYARAREFIEQYNSDGCIVKAASCSAASIAQIYNVTR